MQYRGIVTGGSRKAALLGYPTANILLRDTEVSGSYVALVSVEGKKYPAVAYADQQRHILEAHLLNFSGDLYGKEIAVKLEKKLRDTQSFETDEELQKAVVNDVAQAHAYFTL